MYNDTIADQMFDTYPQQKELGNLLRESRKTKNLDIHQMAEILKVSPSRLKQIENGDFSIMHEIYTKSLVTRYANYTNINIEKLFKQIWDHTKTNASVQNIDDIKEVLFSNHHSIFSKDSVEIDKSGNHIYMFLGGICAILVGVFLLKTYTENISNNSQILINANNVSKKNVLLNSISVLTLDKELRSLDNKKAFEDKSLVAANYTIESKRDNILQNDMIDADFTKNSPVMPANYIIKSNN